MEDQILEGESFAVPLRARDDRLIEDGEPQAAEESGWVFSHGSKVF
jgi:hypothetical protein